MKYEYELFFKKLITASLVNHSDILFTTSCEVHTFMGSANNQFTNIDL